MLTDRKPISLTGSLSRLDATVEAKAVDTSATSMAQKAWDLKAVGFIHNVFNQAGDPALGIPMLLAGPLGQIGKTFALRGLLAKQGAAWFSRGLSLKLLPLAAEFSVETATFGLGARSLTHLIQGPVPWDPASVMKDVGLAAFTLAPIKFGTFIGHKGVQWARGLDELQPKLWTKADHQALFWTSQVSAYLGLVASHSLQAKIFPETVHGSGNIWADALGTQLALGLTSHAGRAALGAGFKSFEQKINAEAQRLYELTKPTWNILPSFRPLAGAEMAGTVTMADTPGAVAAAQRGTYNILGRGESLRLETQNLPKEFKNGELFTVTSGFPNGLTLVSVPEHLLRSAEKEGPAAGTDKIMPEEAVVKTIEAHVSRFKKLRVPPEQFMVVYGGKKGLEISVLKEKIKNLPPQGNILPETFSFAVAAPLARPPLAYLFAKKGNNFENTRNSQIRVNETSPYWTKDTKQSSPVPNRGSDSTLIGIDVRSKNNPESAKKPAEKTPEFLSRTQEVATVHDVPQQFRKILQAVADPKNTSGASSWFIEINQSFLILKPSELEEFSQVNTSNPDKHAMRSGIQEHIFDQIQRVVIERISEDLKRYSIPGGQVINIKWMQPQPATVKIFEENKAIRVAVSGVNIPLRNTMVWRTDFEKGTPIQISKSSTTTPSSSDHPPPIALERIENILDRSLTSDGIPREITEQLQRVGRDEKIQVACMDTPTALKKLKSLLIHQKGRIFSSKTIELNLATGRPDKSFLYDLVEVMRDYPPLEEQKIIVTWNNLNGEIKANMSEGEFHATLMESIEDGMSVFTVILQRNGQKTENTHFYTQKR